VHDIGSDKYCQGNAYLHCLLSTRAVPIRRSFLKTTVTSSFSLWTGLWGVFPCLRLQVEFWYRYDQTVCLFWHTLDVIDGYFPLFPYLFLHRTEEVEGSNPSRSTSIQMPDSRCAVRGRGIYHPHDLDAPENTSIGHASPSLSSCTSIPPHLSYLT
jgi:hypothetical protein